MSEAHYRAGQRALGIQMPLSGPPVRIVPAKPGNLRNGASSSDAKPEKSFPPLDPALLATLPRRPKAWADMVERIRADQVQFWVRDNWFPHFVEFADLGRVWAIISRSGEIQHWASNWHVMRALLLSPVEALEIHKRHPLADISLNDGVLRMQWRRAGDDSTKDAGPKLEAMARAQREGRSCTRGP